MRTHLLLLRRVALSALFVQSVNLQLLFVAHLEVRAIPGADKGRSLLELAFDVFRRRHCAEQIAKPTALGRSTRSRSPKVRGSDAWGGLVVDEIGSSIKGRGEEDDATNGRPLKKYK